MIYFDNASTSFPKAPGVASRVAELIETGCFNINRGVYSGSMAMSEMVFDTRERLCGLFGCSDSRNVIFTSGATQSLNIILKGLLKSGDRVVTSTMEHNSMLRPLHQLEQGQSGVQTEFIRCDCEGFINLNHFDHLTLKLNKKPRAMMLNHASNVCGSVQDVGLIGRLCRERDIIFIVDASQTAGVLPIDIERDCIDVLVFTGHKGLLSVQGIGGFVIGENAAPIFLNMPPLLTGGTGSFSDSLEPPSLLPDRFEAGTLNLPGIAALNASLEHLEQKGVDNIHAHEQELRHLFIEHLCKLPNIRLVGTEYNSRAVAIVSVDFIGRDNGEIADLLDAKAQIMVRSGLHCAPLAHKALNTYPQGTVRFSFGYANTHDEIRQCIEALESIII